MKTEMKGFSFIPAIVLILLVAAMSPPLTGEAHLDHRAITTIVAPGLGDAPTYVVSYLVVDSDKALLVIEEQLVRKTGNGIASQEWMFGNGMVLYQTFIRWSPSAIDITASRHEIPFGKAAEKYELARRIICWYRPWDDATGSCSVSAP